MTTAFQGRTTQEIQQINMYGCTEAELRDSVESSTTFKFCGAAMVAAGFLSDAQEMLERDYFTKDDVRKQLNIAKFILSEMMDEKREAA